MPAPSSFLQSLLQQQKVAMQKQAASTVWWARGNQFVVKKKKMVEEEKAPEIDLEKYPFGVCSGCGQPFTSLPTYKGGQTPYGGDVICQNAGDSSFYIVMGINKHGELLLEGSGHFESFAPGGYMLKMRHPGAKVPLAPTKAAPPVPIIDDGPEPLEWGEEGYEEDDV